MHLFGAGGYVLRALDVYLSPDRKIVKFDVVFRGNPSLKNEKEKFHITYLLEKG